MHPGVPPFPKHFDGKRYFNPDAPQARGFLDVLRWKLTSRPQPSPRFVSDVTPSKPPASVEGNALRVTLINHSTVLLQQSGCNILTDPVWSERATPVSGLGLSAGSACPAWCSTISRASISCSSATIITIIWISRLCGDSLLAGNPNSSFPLEWLVYCDPKTSAPCMNWIGARRCRSPGPPFTAYLRCMLPRGDSSIAITHSGAAISSKVRDASFTLPAGYRVWRAFCSHPRAVRRTASGFAADQGHTSRAGLCHLFT